MIDCYPNDANASIMKRCCVLTPPEYALGDGVLPVVYLLHGIGESETDWHANREIVALIDSLVEARYIPPMVVVMPYGFVSERERTERRMPDRAAFDIALMANVAEVANACQRISPSVRQHAIAGISMGGKQAIEFGLAHPEHFSVVGALSAAIQRSSLPQTFPVLGDPPTLRRQLRFFFSRCGRQDKHGLAAPNEAFATLLRQAGIDCDASIEDGQHNWDFWSSRLAQLFTSIGATLAPVIALRSLLHLILMAIHIGQRETEASPDNAAGPIRLRLGKPAGWSDERYREVLGWCECRLPEGVGDPGSTPPDDWEQTRARWAEVGLARGDEDVHHLYAGFLDACEELLASSIARNAGHEIDLSLGMPAAHWHVAQSLTGSTLTGVPWKNNAPAHARRKWIDDVPVVLLRGQVADVLESLRAARAALGRTYTALRPSDSGSRVTGTD